MEYTLEGIRQRVQVDKLDDDEFDGDIIDRFINDTQRNIFNQYELTFQEKIFEGTLPSGVTMFKFPGDVARLQALTISGPDGSQTDLMPLRMQFRDFIRHYPTPGNNTAGPVSRWALYGGNMLLNAPLDKDYTMTIFYIRKPKKMTNPTDVPEIPEEFEELLVNGAFMRVQQRNEDFDLAAVTAQTYNNDLDLLVTRYGDRIADGPIKMQNQQI